MSWAAIKWVHDLPPDAVDPTGRQILDKLAYRHDDETGECAPGKPYLVYHTGLSEKTIKKWLPKLEKQGWFRSERRKAINGRDDSTQYHLNIGFRPADSAADTGPSNSPQGVLDTPSNEASQGELATPSRGNVGAGGGGNPGPGEGVPAPPQLQDNYQTTTNKDQDPPKTAAVSTSKQLLTFDDFWSAYPSNAEHNRRRYRGDTEKVFNKLKPNQATIQAMLDALAWQREQRDWRKQGGQFVPYPTRWLRAKCWTDPKPAESTRDAGLRASAEAALTPPRTCPQGHGPLRAVRWGKNFSASVCPVCNPGHPGLAGHAGQAPEQSQASGVT